MLKAASANVGRYLLQIWLSNMYHCQNGNGKIIKWEKCYCQNYK